MFPRSRLPFLNPHILLPLSNHALTWHYTLHWRSLVAARSLSSVDSVTPWTAALWLRCPSVSPGVCSDSGPLSQWWHPTIQQPLLSASPPALSLSQHQVVFSSESAPCIRWPKYWNFSFSISPSNEYLGLMSFTIDWFGLLAVQGTSKSLFQHHNLKASVLWHSAFFMVRLSHPHMNTWLLEKP